MAELVIALDMADSTEVLEFAEKLEGTVKWLKVGLQLFTSCGPEIVRHLSNNGFNIFLDLKFYDIPHTVFKAVQAAEKLKIKILSLHMQGGEKMIAAARDAIPIDSDCMLFGVTALTSFGPGEMPGIKKLPGEFGMELAENARSWGLNGVICSGREVGIIKKSFPELLCLCPGIRPEIRNDDQTRTVTPEQAVKNGADFLVVGRPVYESANPMKTVREILAQIS